MFTANIRAVRIPSPNTDFLQSGTLVGWGQLESGLLQGPSPVLQKVLLSVLSQEACRQSLFENNRDGNVIDDSMFCTGPLTGGKIEIN